MLLLLLLLLLLLVLVLVLAFMSWDDDDKINENKICSRSPIQLVDEKGCVVRPKIMSPFKKIKNFDATANVLSYAYFQAFKFPDSMNVHFQCVVQVCRGSCPNPQCGGGIGGGYSSPSSSSSGSSAGSSYSSSGGSLGSTFSSGTVSSSSSSAADGYGSPQAPAIDR